MVTAGSTWAHFFTENGTYEFYDPSNPQLTGTVVIGGDTTVVTNAPVATTPPPTGPFMGTITINQNWQDTPSTPTNCIGYENPPAGTMSVYLNYGSWTEISAVAEQMGGVSMEGGTTCWIDPSDIPERSFEFAAFSNSFTSVEPPSGTNFPSEYLLGYSEENVNVP